MACKKNHCKCSPLPPPPTHTPPTHAHRSAAEVPTEPHGGKEHTLKKNPVSRSYFDGTDTVTIRVSICWFHKTVLLYSVSACIT